MNPVWYAGWCRHGIMIMASETDPSADFMEGCVAVELRPLTQIQKELNRCETCANEVRS